MHVIIKTSTIISIFIVASTQPVYAFCMHQDDLLESDSIQMAALFASEEDLNIYARPEPIYKTPEAQAFQEYGKFSLDLYRVRLTLSDYITEMRM